MSATPQREIPFVVSFKSVFDIPIEDELLKWAKYMKRQNLNYISTTIWGRRQKQEAEIYANVFAMLEKKILREIEFRAPTTEMEGEKDA